MGMNREVLKKLLTGTMIGTLALGLVGCGIPAIPGVAPQSVADVFVQKVFTETGTRSIREEYKAATSAEKAVLEEDLLGVGWAACDALDRGASWSDILGAFPKNGDARAALGRAVVLTAKEVGLCDE